MAEEITAMFPPPIDLKFEKVYWPCILETKKRYCGYPWEKAGKKPELESKGIENIRRDGVLAGGKLVTKAAKTLFDMVVDGNLSFRIALHYHRSYLGIELLVDFKCRVLAK